tara:strand:+ start:359 stop:550 length:192 start_codon:yes stop_codon:yes gene_type:complete
MKIKAKLNKFGNFNAMNVPCSNSEFGNLRDGKEVEVKDEVANKMLAMGIVDKVNSKTAKKGDK